MAMMGTGAIISGASAVVEKKVYSQDPRNLHYYKLSNGLQVFIFPNPENNKIWIQITIKAGSKYDPPDATGLAHYLEHMLFKGTSRIATSNYQEEKKYLDEIEKLYEELRNATTDDERNKIFMKIDSLSQIAAKYAIPNEFDNMYNYIGASFTNAFTSDDVTAYLAEIPATPVEFEKAMILEKERFTDPVFRIFHTELETVYEEFNRNEDNDYTRAYHRLLKLIFPNHPYGTQPTIGIGEHLKKPSILKIKEYFNTYYVPSNMAIIIAGNINPDTAIKIIEKHWASIPYKKVPQKKFEPLKPLNGVIVDTIYGPYPPYVIIGFRLPPISHPDYYPLLIISQLLSNSSQTGLIDINLLLSQKVLEAGASVDFNVDHSLLNMYGTARKGQSLKEVAELLLIQLDSLKKGNFSEKMISAIVDNMELMDKKEWKDNRHLAYQALESFIYDKNWEEIIKQYEILRKITKEDIVKTARKYFGDSYVIVYKEEGEPRDIHKVTKPPITPIQANRETESEFFKEFKKMPSGRLSPRWVNFQNDMLKKQILNNRVTMYYVKSSIPDIFTIKIVYDAGKLHDKKLPFAVRYMNIINSTKLTQEQFRKELYYNAISFSIDVNDDETIIEISGLEKNIEKGISVVFDFLKNLQPDESKLKEMISEIIKERENNMKEKSVILFRALPSFLVYGKENPFNYTIKTDSLYAELNPSDLVQRINALLSYPFELSYYGNIPPEKVTAIFEKYYPLPSQFSAIPPKRKFKEIEPDENIVYWVSYPQKQAEILLVRPALEPSIQYFAYADVLNGYYGAGLSSIVFQEIRERRALAYAARATLNYPRDKESKMRFVGYLGTQADKLNEATSALISLLNEMPKSEKFFEGAKLSALKDIESSIIPPNSIYNSFRYYRQLRYDYDIREKIYEEIQKIDLNALDKFFNENIARKKYRIGCLGNPQSVKEEELQKLGKVSKITVKELFGF